LAFLDPETLTCPQCKRSADMVWIVGIGPDTPAGGAPAYVAVHDSSDWLIETTETEPRWQGVARCPECGATVKTAP